jgi:hypothetical protein
MTDDLAPFSPKGDVPEWRLIYDGLLTDADFGTVITYDMLDDALGRPFLPGRWPIYRARRELAEMRSRWIESVPGVGYEVIEAREHINAAQARKRRARTQLKQMVTIQNVTDLARLTPEELVVYDRQSRINMGLYMIAVQHERRLERIEQVLRNAGLATG